MMATSQPSWRPKWCPPRSSEGEPRAVGGYFNERDAHPTCPPPVADGVRTLTGRLAPRDDQETHGGRPRLNFTSLNNVKCSRRWWSSSSLLLRLILCGSHAALTSRVHRNSVPSTQIFTASRYF